MVVEANNTLANTIAAKGLSSKTTKPAPKVSFNDFVSGSKLDKAEDTSTLEVKLTKIVSLLKQIRDFIPEKIAGSEDIKEEITESEILPEQEKVEDTIMNLISLINSINTKVEENNKNSNYEKLDLDQMIKALVLEAIKPVEIANREGQTIDLNTLVKSPDTKMQIESLSQNKKFDLIKAFNNNNTINVNNMEEDLKELKNLVNELFKEVKVKEHESNLVKNQDVSKIENLLVKLTEVYEDMVKNEPEKIETQVKPTINIKSVEVKDNNDSSTKGNFTDDKAEEVLKKISSGDEATKQNSFNNSLSRIVNTNNQKDIPFLDKAQVVVNRNNLSSDVIKTVKFMEVNDIKDLTVKIVPKELGEIIIKLTQEGSIMKATITSTNKETYQLLNANIQEINSKIVSNNMNIQSFQVDVYNGELGNFNENSKEQHKSNSNDKKVTSNKDYDVQLETLDEVREGTGNVNILV